MEKETLQSFILIEKEWSVLYRAAADVEGEGGLYDEKLQKDRDELNMGFTEAKKRVGPRD